MIYVECNTEESLVRSLTDFRRKEIVHELQGKGGVCNRLSRTENCKGLVDEDPSSGQPRYLSELVVSDDRPALGLRRLQDAQRNNDVIVLCPRLEEWIIAAAESIDVRLADHGLPDRSNLLHRVINLDPTKFERLLEALRGSARMRALREMLTA